GGYWGVERAFWWPSPRSLRRPRPTRALVAPPMSCTDPQSRETTSGRLRNLTDLTAYGPPVAALPDRPRSAYHAQHYPGYRDSKHATHNARRWLPVSLPTPRTLKDGIMYSASHGCVHGVCTREFMISGDSS